MKNIVATAFESAMAVMVSVGVYVIGLFAVVLKGFGA